MLKLDIIENIESKHVVQWNELWDDSGISFFSSWHWYKVSIESDKKMKGMVCFFYEEDRLIAIFPLQHTMVYCIKCVTCAGGTFQDKSTLLVAKDSLDYIPEIINLIRERYNLFLNETESDYWKYINKNYPYELISVNPYLTYKEDVLSQVKRKEWNLIRNKLKKDDVCIKVYEADAIANYIPVLIQIEETSNKISKKRVLFSTNRELLMGLCSSKEAMLLILYLDNTPCAYMFGYNIKNETFMAQHMVYVQEYARRSPGTLIIVYLINYLHERNYNYLDFSRGNTLLKRHYTIYKDENYNIYCAKNWYAKIVWKISMKYRQYSKKLKSLVKNLLFSGKKYYG